MGCGGAALTDFPPLRSAAPQLAPSPASAPTAPPTAIRTRSLGSQHRPWTARGERLPQMGVQHHPPRPRRGAQGSPILRPRMEPARL